MSTIVVDVRGAPQVKAMLDRFSAGALRNRLRRVVRAGANAFKIGIQAAAASDPTGNVPESFGVVRAPKVSAHAGQDIVAKIRPKSPLFNIFEPGAGAHEIGGGLMAGPAGTGGWTAKGRKRPGGFAAHGPVRHPGFAARPILPTAFDSRKDEAMHAASVALFAPGVR